jgi:concentrative nucleoside transporter, CNT family
MEMLRIQSLTGLLALAALAWVLSENRRKVSWKGVLAGILIQLVFAGIVLKVPVFRDAFLVLNRAVMGIQDATKAGTSFVFGYLGGAPLPFGEKTPGGSFILALQALPLVLVVSALSSLLFYWRVLPYIVKAFSFVLEKTLNIGGALGLSAAANIFVGMVESPLLIKPYLKEMTRSELFAVMTCGMATIAGTVMVLYASILSRVLPDAMGQILVASIISAPAALTMARIMIPETGRQTEGSLTPPMTATSAMDAVTIGTTEGLKLLLNIVAMLIVLVALVNLANQLLGLLPGIGGEPLTLQGLLGYVMSPVVWLMGIPWSEAHTAGALMGTKTVLNEFIAYVDLAHLPAGALSGRSRIIMTYAMCGFANFGSLGIMIGGLGGMAPERRKEIIALGLRSIVAGTLATCMTGAVVGIF